MFGIFKKAKDYKVEDLYIGVIGEVRRDNKSESYYCTSDVILNPLIIISKKSEDENIGERYEIQITSNVKYWYFHSMHFLSNHLGEHMIYREIPLVSLFPELKGKPSVTFEEIKNFEERLNSSLHSKEEPEEPIDKVMVEINKLVKNAKNILNKEVKDEILEEIKALATYYVESKITIQMEILGLNLDDPESKLISECLKKLCEIEEKIAKALKDNGLLKDMQILSRNIGSEE